MSVRVYTSVELEPVECCNCGVIFGVPPFWRDQRIETKQMFYCPNGHPQFYTESNADRLRKQLAEEQRKLSTAQFELMAAEKKIKRIEKRVKNGVCPCCNRQFVQLARHMETKHPDYEV